MILQMYYVMTKSFRMYGIFILISNHFAKIFSANFNAKHIFHAGLKIIISQKYKEEQFEILLIVMYPIHFK